MHRLSNINEENRTAYCAGCKSESPIIRRNPTSWKCAVKARQEHKKYVKETNKPKRIMADGFTYTREQKASLAVEQSNLCAICNKEAPLEFDHCHETLTPRGLLCHKCNTGLGMFNDDINNIESALEYLSKYRARG